MAPNVLSKLLDESFTYLNTFCHEQWPEGFGGHGHGFFGTDYTDFLCGHRRRGESLSALDLDRTARGSPLPKSLRSLVIFEDSDPRLHRRGPVSLPFSHVQAIGDILRSMDLRTLALSHIVSAESLLADYTLPNLQSGFLHQTMSQISNRCMFAWPELKNLALTSDTFTNHRLHFQSIVDLAVKMAIALEFMPKVEVFEIWSEGKDCRLVLQFLRTPRGRKSVTLLSEQPIGVDIIVGVQSGLAAVANHTGGPMPALTVAGGIGRGMLEHQKLRCVVLEPLSVLQREVERRERQNS